MSKGDEDLQKEKSPNTALSKLRRRLADLRANDDEYLYDNEEERIEKTKKAIDIYVKTTIEEEYRDKATAKKNLQSLYVRDFLIHKKEIVQYGFSKVEEYEFIKCAEKPALSEQSIKLLPIFCKENIYHACLCCVAVSKYNHNNVKEFFEDKLTNRQHKIEEVSMSLSDQYLIAKSQNTIIIAFAGEKSFTSWFETCEKQQCVYRFEKGS